eukprot:2775280-Pleurochrysis_carterae.AAC.2
MSKLTPAPCARAGKSASARASAERGKGRGLARERVRAWTGWTRDTSDRTQAEETRLQVSMRRRVWIGVRSRREVLWADGWLGTEVWRRSA